MGGVLTHVVIGVVAGLIVLLFTKKLEFFLSILIGNTIVDFFKFFGAAVMQKTVNLFGVEHDETFWFIAHMTNNAASWFALGFFALTLLTFLYHHHIIREKKLWEYDEVVWFFLAGVVIHLVIDLFVIESGPWI